MKHWLGFLIIACFAMVGLTGMIRFYAAMNLFSVAFLVLFVTFVMRGIWRRLGGSSSRHRA